MVRKNMLGRKLRRDLRRNFMQFSAMMLLCFLGTWVFAGLDANWRSEYVTIEGWWREAGLCDLWVSAESFSRQDLYRVAALEGVDTMQPRITLTADCPDLPGSVTAVLHAADGPMTLNTPTLRDGEALSPEDDRGCLVEEQFARAQGLAPGDTLKIQVSGLERTLIVRGTVLSPEYLMTARDMSPDPSTFGFLLMNARVFSELPYNQLILSLREGADARVLEDQIRELVPGAVILTQETHASTLQGRNYISLFRNMSYLFPVLAYFVAALVVVTTISRLMDTQRLQMGTLKALGYANGPIRRHYLSYALIPSVLGSALGLLAANYTLPAVLWKMLEVNLRVPEIRLAPLSLPSWGLAAAEVAVAVIICVLHESRAARETAAELLRPKPPKSGTRVLLERIPFLWKRFSFNTKMVVRNLFRNRGRTLMSMVGMLFCNMLIICSFGLQESLPRFIGQYFSETLRYDLRVELKAGRAGTLDGYRARLDAERVDGVMERSAGLRTSARIKTVQLTVLPEDTVLLALGPGRSVVSLPKEGLVLTEKLAEQMSVSPGDTVSLWLTGEKEPLELPVAGLAEVSIGQGCYMSQTAWERLRKGDFVPTALLLKNPSPSAVAKAEDMDEADTLKYTADQQRQTLRVLESASSAFSILSAVALGLAFVICYNMGNLNFTERVREYATLKVLGYHQREIRSLMFRENNLTAVLGAGAGIPPGILLVRLILKMCEFDQMVFVPYVSARTVLLCSLATFAFTCLIELLITRKVRRVDMVEALKSVE